VLGCSGAATRFGARVQCALRNQPARVRKPDKVTVLLAQAFENIRALPKLQGSRRQQANRGGQASATRQLRLDARKQMAPQALEKAQNAEGKDAGPRVCLPPEPIASALPALRHGDSSPHVLTARRSASRPRK
jgi:hypothetical protein